MDKWEVSAPSLNGSKPSTVWASGATPRLLRRPTSAYDGTTDNDKHRQYEMLPGRLDYWSKCQRCADEESVEALWRLKGIFGSDKERKNDPLR
jgi:hypothetical protein